MRKRTALDFVSQDRYVVDFQRIRMDTGEQFLVPLHGQHRIAAQCILNNQLYEPDTHRLVSALMPILGGSMVHAGTFFGDMLPTFSWSTPGNLYAFEPVLENYVMAKLCVEINSLGNVFLLNAALSHENGVAFIDTGDTDGSHYGGASTISKMGQPTATLAIDSLDLRDITLIQLDVEGYELNALRGAVRTLERDAPIVMIEDNPKNCAPLLQSLDYRHVGEVPGLSIWCRGYHETVLRGLGFAAAT